MTFKVIIENHVCRGHTTLQLPIVVYRNYIFVQLRNNLNKIFMN